MLFARAQMYMQILCLIAALLERLLGAGELH